MMKKAQILPATASPSKSGPVTAATSGSPSLFEGLSVASPTKTSPNKTAPTTTTTSTSTPVQQQQQLELNDKTPKLSNARRTVPLSVLQLPPDDDVAGSAVVGASPVPLSPSAEPSQPPSSTNHAAAAVVEATVSAAPVTDKILGLLSSNSAVVAPRPSPPPSPLASVTTTTTTAVVATTTIPAPRPNIDVPQQTTTPKEQQQSPIAAADVSPSPRPPEQRVLAEAFEQQQQQTPRSPGPNGTVGQIHHNHTTPSRIPPQQTATTPTAAVSSPTAITPLRPPASTAAMGKVHPDTPIPNADVALRLLRKFALKTRPKILTTYGGTKSRSIFSYLLSVTTAGSASQQQQTHLYDVMFGAYRDWIETLGPLDTAHYDDLAASMGDPAVDGSIPDPDSVILESIVGEPGDSMARARESVAKFVHLFGVWGHGTAKRASAQHMTSTDKRDAQLLSDLYCSSLDAAAQLVAHGCLDGVLIVMGNNYTTTTATATTAMTTTTTNGSTSSTTTTTTSLTEENDNNHRAVHLLAQSVFASDLTQDRNELAAMKFLLTTGCRVTPRGDAMLRGSHLLQAIRILYHIYLTTESIPNKTTARAALQQLVTGVFARVVRTDELEESAAVAAAAATAVTTTTTTEHPQQQQRFTADKFPSENHRDAFLVLRAICKLSMRNLPDPTSGMYAHIGLQTSGSNETWDFASNNSSSAMNNSLQVTKTNNLTVKHSVSYNTASSGGAPTAIATTPEDEEAQRERAHLVYTSAIHPALESKLLALELLLYVLQHTDFSPTFIHRSGPQFHAAIRNYLCVSLLKNCTSDDTQVVSLSLSMFVPLMRHFRIILKTEIEAFVTNVFFVILDSKHSPAEHKGIVVRTFDELCSNPTTLAEIFLNYDCDLSAVDLFHRIVNTLSKVSRTGLNSNSMESVSGMMMMTYSSSMSSAVSASGLLGGSSAARMEKFRNETRELRLDAMKALRQILASLYASIVEPMKRQQQQLLLQQQQQGSSPAAVLTKHDSGYSTSSSGGGDELTLSASSVQSPQSSPNRSGNKQTLVEIYGSKKKRRAEESEVILRFNQKPSAGISYAAKCGHMDADDPVDVARFLLKYKDVLDKTQIGDYLGREAEYQGGMALKVLHEYVRLLDFQGLSFDEAIRYFLSGFRLPGEAQKIDRIMEKFAERFTEQNPDVFPTADVAFILAFSIIMLNTDLHNPAIKEDRRMTKEGFVRNNRGICDGQDLPEELLTSIFDRIRLNPISLKEDDEARERVGGAATGLPAALNPASFFASHYDEIDRARESNFQKERDHIVRTTESLLKRRRQGHESQGGKSWNHSKSRQGKSSKHTTKFVRTEDSGLRDEYVSPMFEVTWGPALAAFSTAMESGNGTEGSLISIASDEELEMAAENAAETIEVCLTGFKFAICTAGLCGNDTARDAFVLALSRFSQLGTGVLLEPRHVRCIQTLMSIARDDGELLGSSWEHIFRALSEINRFHQLFHLMARNDRAAAAAANRRRKRIEEKEYRRRELLERRRAASQDGELVDDLPDEEEFISDSDSFESDFMSDEDDDDFPYEEDMDAKMIDEANAKLVFYAVSENTIEAIYERSSTLSAQVVEDFVNQLCRVSRIEISAGGVDFRDLTKVAYRQQHALLSSNTSPAADQFHHTQPNIYNLQKLVEVTHYNMESRPRLIFADLWTIVADHLTGTALHKNPAIAMYAVDSFRQLSIQYLQRDELEVFEFQKRFLKPLEVVMAKSDQTSTKELLLNCVDRIVHVFRVDDTTTNNNKKAKGGLKSGWIPILNILSLGGYGSNEEIAKMSFKILSGEIEPCLRGTDKTYVLLNEHFVEAVGALLAFVSSQHTEIGLEALDRLNGLAGYLSNDDVDTPQLRRKHASTTNVDLEANQELGLWWPMLLGLAKAVGDSRLELRTKALDTLIEMIDSYFFPTSNDSKERDYQDDIQVLQLIFRGVLFPILEHAELDGEVPMLPEDFERFLTGRRSRRPSGDMEEEDDVDETWMATMFDPFLDYCVGLCIRSVAVFQDDSMIEEIFALLNICLLSDSGSLAVRGLQRLEQFITSDLDSKHLNDDVWATVAHMLRRCLSVRDLPTRPRAPTTSGDAAGDVSADEAKTAAEKEYAVSVREFLAEESHFPERRYIGSNATMVIGLLLSSDRFSIGIRWRLFLIVGLGRGILEWEQAASILARQSSSKAVDVNVTQPPDYYETAMYGRKWMNRFILQLASMKEIALAPSDADPRGNRFVAGQRIVTDETQRLLTAFLKQEHVVSENSNDRETVLYEKIKRLLAELLSGYIKMDSEHLRDISWINPILLESCIQSKNEEIRFAVQKLVKRTSAAEKTTSYPTSPSSKAVVASVGSGESSEQQSQHDDEAPIYLEEV